MFRDKSLTPSVLALIIVDQEGPLCETQMTLCVAYL